MQPDQLNKNSFQQLVRSRLKFGIFMFSKLPSAYFSGVRVRSINDEKTEVTVPYKWFSQNPFKSTYFACLAMAGELSTGLIGMMYTYKRQPAISMLVVGLEAKYHKKATAVTIFTCKDGIAVKETIEEAIRTGEGKAIRTLSTGLNENGELVAEFFITWSFKAKSR